MIAAEPFTLRWTSNDWHDRGDDPALPTALGVWYVDLDPRSARALRFTFIRRDEGLQDAREYVVEVSARVAGP